MQCIHKTFYGLRTVFLSIFAFLCISQPVQAANPIYTVADVKVDITAKSAVEAREKAFDQAQADAFNTLAGRMLQPQQLSSFKLPDINTISAMIQDYEIGNEQLSTVRYVASYTFRFKEGAARNYFGSLGADIYGAQAAYTEIGGANTNTNNANTNESGAVSESNAATQDQTQQTALAAASGPVLVLPFLEKGGRTMLWSPYNVWRSAWDKTGGAGAAESVIVPLGDISDISDISDDDALNFDGAKLARLVERYGAVEAVIVIARPDAPLSRVTREEDAAVGVLNVALYRTDMGRADYVHDINVGASNTDTLSSLMGKGVAEVKSALASGWKNKISAPQEQAAPEQAAPEQASPYAADMTRIKIRIPYASLQEWSETQMAMRRVQGLVALNVRSVKPREAAAELTYNGDFDTLRLALTQAGMTLDEGGGRGAISVTSGDSFTSFSEGVSQGGTYTVYLNKFR